MTVDRVGALAPIHCPACGAPVPLGSELEPRCAHCSTSVALPTPYAEAARAVAAAAAARRAAEPHLRRLSWGAGTPTRLVTALFLLAAPPCAALVGEGLLRLDPTVVFAGMVLPSLLPGVTLWAWTVTARELGAEFTAALAAAPPPTPGKPPGCRSCGAPLAVESRAGGLPALSASCGYCGTDSLVTTIPLRAVRSERYAASARLAEAIRALRQRRAMLVLGILGGGAVVGLVSLALLVGLVLTV